MNQPHSGISLIDLFEISLPGFAIGEEELSLVICNKKDSFEYQYVFVSGNSTERNWITPDPEIESVYIFPLYLKEIVQTKDNKKIDASRMVNFNQEMIHQLSNHLSLPFTPEKEEPYQENASPVCYANSEELSGEFKMDLPPQSFAPIDLLDYIYAVLFSAPYNEAYQALSEKDFPVIPYPRNQFLFWKLAGLGAELRKMHLLEKISIKDAQISFPLPGNNEIKEIRFEENDEMIRKEVMMVKTSPFRLGRVYINQEQFFQMVPVVAWKIAFGTHLPAQKWLQVRKGRHLKEEDILFYEKIIGVFTGTNRICDEINKIKF